MIYVYTLPFKLTGIMPFDSVFVKKQEFLAHPFRN